jgi:sulfoxide reductase heme-binding subunit YedZ
MAAMKTVDSQRTRIQIQPKLFMWTGHAIAPLNLITHALAMIPLAVLVLAYQTGNLTANPVQAAEQRTGDTAIVLLLLSLACTPLNTWFGFRPALQLRRPLGMYAFLYASVHLSVFIGIDYGFQWNFLYADLINKAYIYAGLGALLVLLPLAATSWNWWKKRLGMGWKRLHRLVYLAGALAVLHLAWVIKGNVLTLKGDIWKPVLAGVVLAGLLVSRIPAVRRFAVSLRGGRIGRAPKSDQSVQTDLRG